MKLIGKLKEDVPKRLGGPLKRQEGSFRRKNWKKLRGGGTPIFDNRQPKYDKDGNFIGWTGRGGGFR